MITKKWIVGRYVDGEYAYVQTDVSITDKQTMLVRQNTPEYRKAHALLSSRVVIKQPVFDTEKQCLEYIASKLQHEVVTAMRKWQRVKDELNIWENLLRTRYDS